MRMSRLAIALVVCFVIATCFVARRSHAADDQKRPNIVYIYADDWRWDCLGVVQKEQGDKARFPWLETPRLDKLASEGVRFRNSFVVNSLCSPGPRLRADQPL